MNRGRPVLHRSGRLALAGALLTGVLTAAAGAPGAAATPAALPTPAAAAPVPRLHWDACGGGFQCTRATVPLDYDAPRGASISLALIRLPATAPSRRIGSLFVNPGGPGGSGVDMVRGSARALWSASVRARFDIVGFDPRGVARSSPMRCYRSSAAEAAAIGQLPPFPVGREQVVRFISTWTKFGAQCLQNNAAIMQHMATADVARDLDLLRRAAGDKSLTYDGVSYGSYLGDTYADLFPARVRALIIDGVLDPVQWATGTGNGHRTPFTTRIRSARGAHETLQQFFMLCRQGGSACSFNKGGDPKAKYYTLLDRARKHPIVLQTPDGPLRLTYADIASETRAILYSPYDFPALADALQLLWKATSGAAVTLPPGRRPATAYNNQQDSFLGVSCTDTVNPHNPFAWPVAAHAEDRRYRPFGSVWTYASQACATWPARDADRYRGPFTARTANPVLVIGNTYDPATPYQGAQTAARLLPRARLLTLHGWGHTSLGKSTCIDRYVTAYLVRKALPAQGTVCAPDYVPFQSAAPSARRRAAAAAVADLTSGGRVPRW